MTLLSFPAFPRPVLTLAVALVATAAPAAAQIGADEGPLLACCVHHQDGAFVPAGVMAGHLHPKGGWMVAYRLMYGDTGGLRSGTGDYTHAQAVLDGYTSVPTRMEMTMHMLDFMYAPTDWLTLMAMPQYMEMDMEMLQVAEAHGHGHGGGHGHMVGDTHGHGTAGWSDTVLSALVRVWHNDTQALHLGLGLSLPTGSVTERGLDGSFVHYGMQLGSGTWDFRPSLTWNARFGRWTAGAQVAGVRRLEDSGESGFRFGHVFEATAWGGYALADWCALGVRAAWRSEGTIQGHYNGPHNHSSPPDLQRNYGGDWLDVGAGLSLRGTGAWDRASLALELLGTPWQDVNGVQLERELTVNVAVGLTL